VGGLLAVGTVVVGADAQAQQQPLKPAAATFASLTSGIQIQNLGTLPANATIDYYNTDGSLAFSQALTSPIPVNGSFTAFGSTMKVPTPFAGSAVVSADQPVSAIVNLLSSGPTTGEAYDGVNTPGAVSNIPLFQQNNAGFNTTLHIQNTTGSPNTVTVTFQGTGAPAPLTFNLPSNGSIAVDATNDQIVGKFVGSVVVSGTQGVAVEVNQTNNTILFANTGSVTGGTTLYAPLLMTNNHGFSTGFQVQNTGSIATDLSLFLNGSSTAAETVTVQPGQSHTWYPIPGTVLGSGTTFIGSGTVTSNNAQPLLGTVNELSTGGQGMAYNAFTAGTQSVQMPLVMFNNSAYYTGEQIQNIGTTSATVDLIVNGNVVDTQTIAAGASYTWFSFTNSALYGGAKVSSAVAKGHSTTDQLVGIVNEITNPQVAGDSSFAYEGFNAATAP